MADRAERWARRVGATVVVVAIVVSGCALPASGVAADLGGIADAHTAAPDEAGPSLDRPVVASGADQPNPSSEFANQWALNTDAAGNVNIGPAWALSHGEGMVVAVIDSGVDQLEPSFSGDQESTPFRRGWNVLDSSRDTDDVRPGGSYHGTSVAALIAASRGGRGITGVAPRAGILPIVAHPGQLSDIAVAIQRAVDADVDVINISLELSGQSEALASALQHAERAGIPVVVAAGNRPCDLDTDAECASLGRYARDYSNVIAVTGVDSDGGFAPSFAYGANTVALAAPGVGVRVPSNRYIYDDSHGTSLAAAHVSGAIAMMRQMNPSLSPARIRDILIRTVTPSITLSHNTISGGFLNAGEAVREAAAHRIDGQRVTLRPTVGPLNRAVQFTSYDSRLSLQAASEVLGQQFTVERAPGSRVYQLRHSTGQYLGYTDEGQIRLQTDGTAPCDPGPCNADWTLQMAADHGSYVLRAGFSGATLAVTEGQLRLEAADNPQVFRLVVVGGVFGTHDRVSLHDFDNRERQVVTFGGGDVSVAVPEEDTVQWREWDLQWSSRYGAYRIGSTADRLSALGFRMDGHEIYPLVDTDHQAAFWIPQRAANGSVVFFNAERTNEALQITQEGRLRVDEYTDARAALSRWIVHGTCQLHRAARSASDPACSNMVGPDSLAGTTVTIRPHLDRSIAIGHGQAGIRYESAEHTEGTRFEMIEDKDGGAFVFKNTLTDRYLTDGNGVVSSTTELGDASSWYLLSAFDGSYVVSSVNGFQCIAGSAHTVAGSEVVLAPCDGEEGSKPLAFVPVGGALGSMEQISFLAGNKQVVDAAGSEGTVSLWRDHGGVNQKLRPVWDERRGAYRFVFKRAGTDLVWGSVSHGDGVGHWVNNNADDHYWILRHDGDLGMVLSSYKDPSMVLQYPRSSTGGVVPNDGGAITVGTYTGENHQRWNAHGSINAMSATGTHGEFWLFRGDQYVRYDNADDAVIAGTLKTTIAQGWPGLRGHPFVDGIDAMSPLGEDEYWMFKGDQLITYSTRTESIVYDSQTLAERWPGLRGHPFADGIDAISPTRWDNAWWLFKGDQFVTMAEGRITNSGPISSLFPGLRGHRFAEGIDAITPTEVSDEYWMFSGDRYIRCSTKTDSIIGVHDQLTWEGWPGLRKW